MLYFFLNGCTHSNKNLPLNLTAKGGLNVINLYNLINGVGARLNEINYKFHDIMEAIYLIHVNLVKMNSRFVFIL